MFAVIISVVYIYQLDNYIIYNYYSILICFQNTLYIFINYIHYLGSFKETIILYTKRFRLFKKKKKILQRVLYDYVS